MPRESERAGRPTEPRDRPIRPGSPLYRLLQMIARAIAADLPDDRASRDPGPVDGPD